ncbi:MAG: phage tail tip lysozyme [Ruminococcus bromii]|nr:phage tail tip lysozyme [Ruminococcus bromii]
MRYLNKSLAIILLIVFLCSSVITAGATSVTKGKTIRTVDDVKQEFVYVLQQKGFDLKQISGLWSNVLCESGGDYTAVEGVFDKPFSFEEKKKAVISANNDCGIGLMGFTGEYHRRLCDYANVFDKRWYNLDVQMAYMLDAKYINNYLARWLVNDYKNMSFSSAGDAALVVYSDYFKLPYNEKSAQERTAKAEETYNSLSKQDSPFVSRICDKVDRYLDYAEPYDANGDKFLTIMDVTDLQRSLAEFPDVDINLAVCDADGDGHVMVNDVTEMQRVIAGMVDDSFV